MGLGLNSSPSVDQDPQKLNLQQRQLEREQALENTDPSRALSKNKACVGNKLDAFSSIMELSCTLKKINNL